MPSLGADGSYWEVRIVSQIKTRHNGPSEGSE